MMRRQFDGVRVSRLPTVCSRTTGHAPMVDILPHVRDGVWHGSHIVTVTPTVLRGAFR
jgi:hypothetical protein